jgi:hypothetical protein
LKGSWRLGTSAPRRVITVRRSDPPSLERIWDVLPKPRGGGGQHGHGFHGRDVREQFRDDQPALRV